MTEIENLENMCQPVHLVVRIKTHRRVLISTNTLKVLETAIKKHPHANGVDTAAARRSVQLSSVLGFALVFTSALNRSSAAAAAEIFTELDGILTDRRAE